ncbi:uncharacterized protein ACLA_080270 [Aspergillus clavatus NRRL 1]|uniref:Uncharacterized protein n=1 Tax=Aspergillus clavatus (strain ATCC 1007 / CBS 513.65 / DSM 816 / NCTC 3887 / NRRL 1 / QM 1276 / 107) TaxID=344612 RepID=A1CSQ6_ASPCL|nr:uncharacterized protein ACLA_080270 [Aspergillus clavatus NRRL 1]EAW06343.1 hypothetical protein ACLA_080270 [Aspergillus clavatus NRRL 1]
MDSETRTWTDYFFSNYQPSFDLTNSSFDPETFQQFQYKQRHWRLGRRLDERDFSYREQPPALVRRLYAKTREGTVKYAAKTCITKIKQGCNFAEFPRHDTLSIWSEANWILS